MSFNNHNENSSLAINSRQETICMTWNIKRFDVLVNEHKLNWRRGILSDLQSIKLSAGPNGPCLYMSFCREGFSNFIYFQMTDDNHNYDVDDNEYTIASIKCEITLLYANGVKCHNGAYFCVRIAKFLILKYILILFFASNASNGTVISGPTLKRIYRQLEDNQFVGAQLTIQCELTFYYRSPVAVNNNFTIIKRDIKTHPLIKKLMSDSAWHIVTFDVKRKLLSAPFTLLAAQSKVFAEMFAGEWTEAAEKCIKIDNIEPEVFAELLLFLITGSVSNNEKLTIELLAAAEMVLCGLSS